MGVVPTSVDVQMVLPILPSILSPTAWWHAGSITLADGTPVTTWADSSGNGRDLTQGTASQRPVFIADKELVVAKWPVRRPCVLFDGSNDRLDSSATLAQVLGANGVGTIFVVFLQDPTQTSTERYLFVDTNGIVGVFYNFDTTPVRRISVLNTDSGGADRAYDPTIPGQPRIAMWGHDATNLYIGENVFDDSQIASIVSGTTTLLTGTLQVGAGSVGNAFDGCIAEIIVYSSWLSQADRRRVGYYLALKYGLLVTEDFAVSGGQDSAPVSREITIPPDEWTSVVVDVSGEDQIQFRYGIAGTGDLDRVAEAGTLELSLINYDSAGNPGYYSPDNPKCRAGFEVGVKVRVAIVYGGVTYYKWRGKVTDIAVVPGKQRRIVAIRCVDWMDEAARTKPRGLTVQIEQRADQLFSLLLAAIDSQPAATSIDTDTDRFAAAFDNAFDESTTLLSEFQKLAASEFASVFVKGNTTQGETLTFEGRRSRGLKTTNSIDVTDAESLAVQVRRTRDDMANRVKVQVRPRRIDPSATTVLFSLGSPQFIPRFTMPPVFICPYRDPSQPAIRVGGTELVVPEPTTDYLFFENRDGTGEDRTAQLAVTADYGSNTAAVEVLNSGTAGTNRTVFDGWLTKLQLRGKGVYSFEPMILEASDDTIRKRIYGEAVVAYDMPYQNSLEVGLDIAHYILNRSKLPATKVEAVTFLANESDTLMTQALAREISDRVGFSESVTGVSALVEPAGFYINEIAFDMRTAGSIRCTWRLIPADTETFWILGTAGFGELDSSTRLGFGSFLSPALAQDVRALLSGYWPLDEKDAGIRYDRAKQSHLAPTNAPVASAGQVGMGNDFERSSSQYLSVADNADLSTGDIHHFCFCWVKPEAFVAGSQIIAGKRREWSLYTDDASGRCRYEVYDAAGASLGIVGSVNLTAGAWHFLVGWHDPTANQVNLQVNNGTVESAPTTGPPTDTTQDFAIGAVNALNHWDGMIDELGFGKATLTEAMRALLWNGGNGIALY